MPKTKGRSTQRARTRQAILDGARQLLSEGKTVTVAAAAAETGISKATSYRYFSDADLLVAEAVLDIAVKPYDAVISGAPDLRGKLKAICLYFLDLALENEPEFRQFLAASMRAWSADNKMAVRGGRRVSMFHRALSEHETGLSEDQKETLVCGLSVSTGMEALIALIDVAGASPDRARDVVSFMVDAMLDRML